MFDDLNKDLKWLEQQLRAVEAPQEEDTDAEDCSDEDFPIEEEDWLDSELQKAHALLNDSPSHSPLQTDVFAFLEEDIKEEDDSPVYADAPAPAQPKNTKKKKEKGVGGLVFLACLETLGIIAVLIWWVLWLL